MAERRWSHLCLLLRFFVCSRMQISLQHRRGQWCDSALDLETLSQWTDYETKLCSGVLLAGPYYFTAKTAFTALDFTQESDTCGSCHHIKLCRNIILERNSSFSKDEVDTSPLSLQVLHPNVCFQQIESVFYFID